MSTKHTPGPWSVVNEHDEVTVIAGEHISHGFKVRYEIARDVGGHRGDEYANARLIAAAPDLLEAIQALLRKVECGTALHCDLCDAARAAIAKATGGAQ